VSVPIFPDLSVTMSSRCHLGWHTYRSFGSRWSWFTANFRQGMFLYGHVQCFALRRKRNRSFWNSWTSRFKFSFTWISHTATSSSANRLLMGFWNPEDFWNVYSSNAIVSLLMSDVRLNCCTRQMWDFEQHSLRK